MQQREVHENRIERLYAESWRGYWEECLARKPNKILVLHYNLAPIKDVSRTRTFALVSTRPLLPTFGANLLNFNIGLMQKGTFKEKYCYIPYLYGPLEKTKSFKVKLNELRLLV